MPTPARLAIASIETCLPAGAMTDPDVGFDISGRAVLEVAVHAGGNERKMLIERNTGLAPHEFAQASASLAQLRVS